MIVLVKLADIGFTLGKKQSKHGTGGQKMEKVFELLKRTFEMWAEKRWLKEIDKAVDRYKKAQSKANREYFVMKKLCERYNELYHRNLMEVKDGK